MFDTKPYPSMIYPIKFGPEYMVIVYHVMEPCIRIH